MTVTLTVALLAVPQSPVTRTQKEFVPFVSSTIAENLAIYMHRKSQTSIVLPFDVRDDDSPPRRGLVIVTDYFRRAAEAGRIRVNDPRAAALLFMGSLQSYVLLHQVFNIAPQPASASSRAIRIVWYSTPDFSA